MYEGFHPLPSRILIAEAEAMSVKESQGSNIRTSKPNPNANPEGAGRSKTGRRSNSLHETETAWWASVVFSLGFFVCLFVPCLFVCLLVMALRFSFGELSLPIAHNFSETAYQDVLLSSGQGVDR